MGNPTFSTRANFAICLMNSQNFPASMLQKYFRAGLQRYAPLKLDLTNGLSGSGSVQFHSVRVCVAFGFVWFELSGSVSIQVYVILFDFECSHHFSQTSSPALKQVLCRRTPLECTKKHLSNICDCRIIINLSDRFKH